MERFSQKNMTNLRPKKEGNKKNVNKKSQQDQFNHFKSFLNDCDADQLLEYLYNTYQDLIQSQGLIIKVNQAIKKKISQYSQKINNEQKTKFIKLLKKGGVNVTESEYNHLQSFGYSQMQKQISILRKIRQKFIIKKEGVNVTELEYNYLQSYGHSQVKKKINLGYDSIVSKFSQKIHMQIQKDEEFQYAKIFFNCGTKKQEAHIIVTNPSPFFELKCNITRKFKNEAIQVVKNISAYVQKINEIQAC